ncbi:UNVERIFIED_CONTAM: hypothetical protein Sradi_6949700 [Sesamum radiatum]|uniref:Uncharacterized protein n=1 Tax=Sesamum radiatum TaxID=300843 RepID=A0AAW2JHI3_SESRA
MYVRARGGVVGGGGAEDVVNCVESTDGLYDAVGTEEGAEGGTSGCFDASRASETLGVGGRTTCPRPCPPPRPQGG